MSNILKAYVLGDSNIYRYATADRLSAQFGCPVTMINVTRLTSLEVGLETAKDDSGRLVVLSALSNIVSDVGRSTTPEQLEQSVRQTVVDYLELVSRKLASKDRVLILQPFYRADPKWFVDFLPLMKTCLISQSTQYTNFTVLPEFSVSGVDLMDDGVHLLPEKGVALINHMSECVKDVLIALRPSTSSRPGTSARLLLQGNTNPTVMDVVGAIQTSILPQIDELSGMKSRMATVERTVFTRLDALDVAAARRAEGEDHLKNKATSDRVVVIGFKCDDYPSTQGERKTYLSQKFRDLIEEIVGEVVCDIYPKDENCSSGLVPAFEIRFPSVKVCQDFRKVVFRKVQEDKHKEQFGGVAFYPKVTVATRVRFEVMRAIARKLTADEESGYCPIYESRPVLHVGPRQNGKVTRRFTLTYVDAILRYRPLINVNDLSFAYKRIGEGFKNELPQTFLILRNEDRSPLPQGHNSGISGVTRGVKRKMDTGRGRGIGKRGK